MKRKKRMKDGEIINQILQKKKHLFKYILIEI
jgi:hypothetical protein